MSRDILTITSEDDVAQALARMNGAGIRRLPVVSTRRSEVVVVGMISDRDVRLASNSPYLWGTTQQIIAELRGLRVADIMSSPVITIVPTAPIAEAARLMFKHRIGGLPVVLHSGGRPCLVGLVTRSDILSYLVDRDGDDLESEVRLEECPGRGAGLGAGGDARCLR